jgi:hypothetical protein
MKNMHYRRTADEILTAQALQNLPLHALLQLTCNTQKQSVSSLNSNISAVLVKRSAVDYERLSLEANQ